MLSLTVIANCQASPVCNLIARSSSRIHLNRLPPIHTIRNDGIEKVRSAVRTSDILVHQPIGPKFGPISMEALRSEFPDKTYVSFPSIYFAGTLPHLTYLRLPGGGTLKGPLGDYHDTRILRAFVRGRSEAQCLAELDLFDIDIRAHYASCLEESQRRDSLTDIPVMDIVQERIEANQTFYTFNHCDNHVLWTVARRVLEKLGIEPDGPDAPPKRPMLGSVVAAVPSSIPETLGMTWRQDSYVLNGDTVQNLTLVGDFYSLYSSCDTFDVTLNHNRARFALDLD